MSWQWYDTKPAVTDQNMEPENTDAEAEEPEDDGAPDADDLMDQQYAYGEDWD